MKKIPLLICYFLALALESYSQTLGKSYDFPIKRGTDQWHALQSYEDKRAACQLPEAKLKSLSTDDLIETYLAYPLLGDIMVFNSPQEGIDRLQMNFNGVRELLQRKDVGTKLIAKYKLLNPEAIEANWSLVQKGEYSFKIQALEMLLAQDKVLITLDNKSEKALLKIAIANLNTKKKNKEVYGSTSYVTTCWIMARSLEKANYSLSLDVAAQRRDAQTFTQKGIAMNYSVLDEVVNQTKTFLTKK